MSAARTSSAAVNGDALVIEGLLLRVLSKALKLRFEDGVGNGVGGLIRRVVEKQLGVVRSAEGGLHATEQGGGTDGKMLRGGADRRGSIRPR